MNEPVPDTLGIIAGKGVYPLLLAEAARKQGVKRIVAVAFRRETERAIRRSVDEVSWVYVGQYGRMLDAMKAFGVKHAVMAGQITPTHFFNVRLDVRMVELLKRLKIRNAQTVFGAVADDLRAQGVDLLHAGSFMQEYMPGPGTLTRREPTAAEWDDIRLGLKVADATSGVDVGQTVVVKQGAVMAVEAFEGTDETIRRAGRVGGHGCVVVKVAKRGHDMRFDIPVIGIYTMKMLRKERISVLAVQANRCIFLELGRVVVEADRLGVALVSVNSEESM